MVVNECRCCGKKFFARSKAKGYCSVACRHFASEQRRRAAEQLCWSCANAGGKCSWSNCFKPIPGWDAEPVVTKDNEGDISTYKIKGCPQFIFG